MRDAPGRLRFGRTIVALFRDRANESPTDFRTRSSLPRAFKLYNGKPVIRKER